MPTVYLTLEDKIDQRLSAYVYGELMTRRIPQGTLAKELGISQPALSQKLRKKKFSFDDFVRIIHFFKPDEKELNRLVGFD